MKTTVQIIVESMTEEIERLTAELDDLYTENKRLKIEMALAVAEKKDTVAVNESTLSPKDWWKVPS